MAVIIQEDYASFELTRVLKQKGYPLVKVVKDNGDKPLFYDLPKDHPNWNDCDAWYTPTLYQVQKWLRKEHKIYIVIDRSWSMTDSWNYYIVVNNDFDNSVQQISMPNRSYELALQDGIMEALKRINKEEQS